MVRCPTIPNPVSLCDDLVTARVNAFGTPSETSSGDLAWDGCG